jgi:ATP-dependent Zn protease
VFAVEEDDIMTSKLRTALICAVGILLAGMALASQRSQSKLTYSQFLEQVRSGQVVSVIVKWSNSGATQATCRLRDGTNARTILPSDYRDAMVAMQEKRVNVEIQDPYSGPLGLIGRAVPFFVLIGVWVFLMRKFPNRLVLSLPIGLIWYT